MTKTPSNMLPLGTIAPDFQLFDTVSGKMLSLNELKSDKATVIAFICNHCPFVLHIRDKLIEVAKHYQSLGIQFIAISANDAETYPADSPENMSKEARENGFSFPYLYDEDQSVAKTYQAACTPDFYIFDDQLKCVYRGQFDDARPGNAVPVTGQDLCTALDNILAGKPISDEQKPSLGCNIKWKS